jgi:hypothetical protein
MAAYRKSLELTPELGEAYWSLANLKTFEFTTADMTAMRAQLERATLTDEDRLHFHFALGKALEDRDDYAASFEHYVAGNAPAQEYGAVQPDGRRRPGSRSITIFTREFLEARRDTGSARPIRSSSSDCRAPGRRSSNRYSRATRPSKARWNCRT